MMKKAFFYDTLCGMVYRCMFAGLDECGHAQWVSITPGEESKTLQDVVIDEELQGYRFILICMDDEPAQPEIIFKALSKATVCSVYGVGAELVASIRRMKQIGVSWTKEPLELEFRVFENNETSKCPGKYSIWVQDKKDDWNVLADFDAFDDLNELFLFIRNIFMVLEISAEIPVLTKDLRITDDLRKHVRKSDLGMFSSIQKEEKYTLNKEEN
jgi:hypothetical protein